MIDSVLKGTGNSRFLKSAVPAGTSWAYALAMLQAGTFPIDFNGINTEGFQQVGTPLNKANLLKDATAAQIGLPPSTTPDGMFQALGNTGELHVWRKTVTTTQEVPGGYTLGEALNDVFLVKNENSSSYVIAYVYLATSISANDDGVISADWGNQRTLSYNGEFVVNGPMYMKIDSVHANSTSDFHTGDIVFIPNGYSTRKERGTSGYSIYFDRCQKVNPYPKTPVRTTTTYPVSTNPNAYQEGSDAKPARYVVGDVVTGKVLASKCYNETAIYYGKSVSVSDDGIVSILNPTTRTLSSTLSSAEIAAIKDGFVYFSGNENYSDVSSAFRYGNIVYIPADASVSTEYANSAYGVYIDRYQPVTGYAAIPAGTTIEYLGKLGDKARVQVVSYVGTGTYGSGHPNSLTFGNLPEAIIFLGNVDSSGIVYNFIYTQEETRVLYPKIIPNGGNYVKGYGFGYGIYGKRDGNTISWYSMQNQDCQANRNGYTFYYLVLS